MMIDDLVQISFLRFLFYNILSIRHVAISLVLVVTLVVDVSLVVVV